jgi:uncharacterized membrane protein YfcA
MLRGFSCLSKRKLLTVLILPIGWGAVLGGVIGGLIVGLAPVGIIKLALGALLIWSAWKVFAHHGLAA